MRRLVGWFRSHALSTTIVTCWVEAMIAGSFWQEGKVGWAAAATAASLWFMASAIAGTRRAESAVCRLAVILAAQNFRYQDKT